MTGVKAKNSGACERCRSFPAFVLAQTLSLGKRLRFRKALSPDKDILSRYTFLAG